MAKIDLTGQRFGRLEVLHEVDKVTKNRRWRCLCDCGNYTNIDQNNLRSDQTKSCGCLQKEVVSESTKTMHAIISDITGKKFGMLTAVKKTRKNEKGSSWLWLCQCDCGNKKEVATGDLKSMLITSCGCITRIQHDSNEDILSTLISIYIKHGRLSRSELAQTLNQNIQYLYIRFEITRFHELWDLVEKRKEITEKYPRIKNLIGLRFRKLLVTDKIEDVKGRTTWRCLCSCGNEVDVKGVYLTTGQTKSCGCFKKDKEERNLRKHYDKKRVDGVVKPLFKGQEPRKDSSTGYRGVSKYYTRKSKEERYRAWITVKGKRYYKSGFLTPEEAYNKGRLELEKKHLPRRGGKQ